MVEATTSKPSFIENALGAATLSALAFMGISFFLGGELVGELQEIPGLAAVLFFGKLWSMVHAHRIGIKHEDHPIAPLLRHGETFIRRKPAPAAS